MPREKAPKHPPHTIIKVYDGKHEVFRHIAKRQLWWTVDIPPQDDVDIEDDIGVESTQSHLGNQPGDNN